MGDEHRGLFGTSKLCRPCSSGSVGRSLRVGELGSIIITCNPDSKVSRHTRYDLTTNGMILRNLQLLPASLLALIATATAVQLPYNPTRILVAQNGSSAYIFSSQPSSSQFDLLLLNTSDTVTVSDLSLSTIYTNLPFLSTSKSNAFIPLADEEGDITVLSGDCNNGGEGSQLWRFMRAGD